VAKEAERLKSVNSWPSPALMMFAGKISPEKCVEDAANGKPADRWMLSGACFYAGEKKLLDGDEAAALEFFRKCVATKDVKSLEYFFAKKELDALKRPAR
jgi:lipoprotein NlpI